MSQSNLFEQSGAIAPVTDPADPRIAAFRDIRERDLTGRHGFIAEGTVVLDQLALSARFRPSSVLVLRNRLEGIADRLARLPKDCPVYVVERELIDRIAGFPMHRGVLAHGVDTMPERTAADVVQAARDRPGPILVAIGMANHDNVGALFRNARAFGVAGVMLDETSCNPLYRKALRVSVGTVLTEDWCRFGGAGDLITAVETAGYTPIALTPHADETLDDFDPAGSIAFVVGAEGPGLPQDILDRARGVRIAMEPDVDSLNVATSAAIVLSRLYEARAKFRR
ncbi:RNA methyltransferase [Fulvimarina sp. MAC8]|uniref:TrmH family RNA methyltransferase n=1 Tax=Fulvimarina sp. MAC8 TaxID=3162874 RepID=UPI0032EE3248